MIKDELIAKIKGLSGPVYEDNQLELKAGSSGFPGIYDTLSSFSNQDSGGLIIIGVDEKSGKICGVQDATKFVKRAEEVCKAMHPQIQAVITCVEIDELNVIGIEVPGLPFSQRPCYEEAKGAFNSSYVRVGDADRKMPMSTLFAYLNYANHIWQDELPVVGADVSDLCTIAFQKYKINVSELKSNFANQSDADLLENSGFTVKGVPTVAGLLTLAEFPQKYFRNFYISASVCGSNETDARILDGEHIDGSISEMLEAAMRFINRNTRHSILFKGVNRIDIDQYPEIALRELIMNALVHRDYGRYSEGRCINLVVYPDKIVIASPGLLYGSMTISDLCTAGISREIRNPAITSGLEFLMRTENKGTGIRVARQAMQKQGLKEPEFEQDVATDTFIVTLKSEIGRQNQTCSDTNYFDEPN